MHTNTKFEFASECVRHFKGGTRVGLTTSDRDASYDFDSILHTS
jgi:hypothetical protein